MASSFSIEIGSHSIRAMALQNGKTQIVPLGHSSSPFTCPSVVARINGGLFLFGDMAENWLYYKPEYFEHIQDIYSESTILTEIYKHLFDFVIERIVMIGFERPCSCNIIVPAYYDNLDSKKTKLKSAAHEAGIQNVRFQSDIEALCSKKVHLSSGEIALTFDLGYSGLTACIVKSHGNQIIVVKSLYNSDVGGRVFDGLIQDEFENKLIYEFHNDYIYNLFIKNKLAKIAEMVKEDLSYNDTCTVPIITTEYTINQQQFRNMIASSLSSSLKTIKVLIEQSNLGLSDISVIYLCGGCSNIPYIEKMLRHFWEGYGIPIEILKLSDTIDYKYSACKCSLSTEGIIIRF